MEPGIRRAPPDHKTSALGVCECSHGCYGERVSEKRNLLQNELTRLEGLLQDLERDWKRVPYALVLVLAAIPMYLQFGVLGSSLTILTVVSFIGTAYYLIGVRKAEYRGEMEEIRLDLQRLTELESASSSA